MKPAVYDIIGANYDNTRKADPGITERLIFHLKPVPQGRYLDVGCGTGNYTRALFDRSHNIEGMDISSEMLKQARQKSSTIVWHNADAMQMPFPNNYYDGAICVLATHHMGDCKQAFKEIFRIISEGRFVIFTATPEQMASYWLCEYFPEMMKKASQLMHTFEHLESTLIKAGFKNLQSEPFFITKDLEDQFLYAGKYKPEVYLDEKIREGISSFHLSITEDEIKSGTKALERDILSGKIHEVIDKYESRLGEYLFIVAEK